MDPDWLTPAQLRAWMPVGAVLLSVPSALDTQLQRDAGISYFAYLVLAALADGCDRTARMSDLAMLASGSLSRLSHTVAGLEKRGWVRRSRCPGDGRVTLAILTDDGMAALAEVAPAHVASVRRLVVDVLTAEQLHHLGEAARAIISALAPDDAGVRRRLDL